MSELELTIRILVVPLLLYIAYEHVRLRERVAALQDAVQAIRTTCRERAKWIANVDHEGKECGQRLAGLEGEHEARKRKC
jgi:hypothetical protein